MSVESGLPGCAEATSHGASGLSADAHRCASVVVHQHGLNGVLSIEKMPQKLYGVSVVADRAFHLDE